MKEQTAMEKAAIRQDENDIKCPICGKKFSRERFNFEWFPVGYKGKCPGCKGKVISNKPARGLIRTPSGQLIRSAGRRKKK